jgi:hypothetical protein
MNLSIAAKLGLPALALAAALVACPDTTVPTGDTVAPTIASVTPTGTTVAKAVGKISVSFSEAMDTSVTAGVVAFTLPATGAPAITAPTWSADKKTLSVTIPALTASTNYKFNVTALAKDVAGNKFVPGTAGYSFTTAADTVVGGTLYTANTSSDGTVLKAFATPTGYAFYPTAADLAAPDTDLSAVDRRTSMRVGNVNGDSVGRGVMRFALPSAVVTAGATKVNKAELVLTQYKVTASPATGAWASALNVEGLNFAGAAAGANVEADFGEGTSAVVATAANTFAGPSVNPGDSKTITFDVTAYVKAQLTNTKANADFRARFATEAAATGAAQSDVRFYTNDAATGKPVLNITVAP